MESILLFAPLFGVNIWHAAVICMSKIETGRFASISESALLSPLTLCVHRTVHVLGALCFIAFGVLIIDVWWPGALLLVLAAVFDVFQALYLNKKTNHRAFRLRDAHQVLAWTMAVCYMLFCLLFTIHTHVDLWLVASYVGILLSVIIWNQLTRFAYFWVAQMIFFVLTSVMMGISYLS